MRRFWLLLGLPALLLAGCGGAAVDTADVLKRRQVEARRSAAFTTATLPVIVLTPTTAHLHVSAEWQEQVSLDVRQANLLEAVALAPQLVWWRLAPVRQLRAKRAEQLVQDARTLAALQAQLNAVPEPHQGRAIALLTATRAFLEAQSRRGTVDRPMLAAFIRRHRVLSDQLLKDAAEARMTRLHTVVQAWWQRLDAGQRATLRAAVIDTAAHREGHPQVQYLMQAMGVAGEGQRITYLEGGDVRHALEAVADLAQGVELGIEGYADPLHLRQAPTAPGARQVLEGRDVRLK